MEEFRLSGALRRIRRRADLSQRQLASKLAVSQSAVAQAENGRRDLPVGVLLRAAALAGLRLALLDAAGHEVAGMADDTVRDMGRRRMPAHLDTFHSDEREGRYQDRYYRGRPWYTFDLSRATRDELRNQFGTPDDHLHPEPGTEPWLKKARRRREALRQAAVERERAFLAGELRDIGPDFLCTCPPGCDPVVERTGDVHVENCGCQCDLA